MLALIKIILKKNAEKTDFIKLSILEFIEYFLFSLKNNTQKWLFTSEEIQRK